MSSCWSMAVTSGGGLLPRPGPGVRGVLLMSVAVWRSACPRSGENAASFRGAVGIVALDREAAVCVHTPDHYWRVRERERPACRV